MISDVTLTTCCFDLTSYNKNSRDIVTSISTMRTLLEIPCYLIIFCDAITFPHIKKLRGVLSKYTHYILTDLKSIWTYNYVDIIRKNRKKYHPTKDKRTSPESHALVCNKFDFVLQTIALNPFKTSKFGWIDANIGVDASKIATKYTPNLLPDILNKVTDKFHIQILNVVDKRFKKLENLREYYSHYPWVVCGCLFTCSKKSGIPILNRLKELFIETINAGYGHAEEGLYLNVLDEFYDDIQRSYGDYSHTLNNFIKPTIGFEYICNTILRRYIALSYYKEAYECGTTLLKEYSGQNDGIWFHIIFKTLISVYNYKPEQLKELFEYLKKEINTNKKIYIEYEKDKDFYDSQFALIK